MLIKYKQNKAKNMYKAYNLTTAESCLIKYKR